MRRPATLRGVLVTALAAFTVAAGIVTLVVGYSPTAVVRAVQVLTVLGFGAVVIGGTIMLALVHLADWRSPDDEFERIVQRAERLAVEPDYDDGEDDYGWDEEHEHSDFSDEEDFKTLVRCAVDELPLEFHRALEHVAIVVADGGARVRVGRGRRAIYGLFQGDSVTQDYFHDRIVIFRDTLLRDFGHDPELLREQVLLTVRKELAGHVGSGAGGFSNWE